MSIPQAFIQELLSRVDVVEVVGRYVQLKKAGANFMGLCPFHGEKSPSFSVSPAKQFYHCFGCGVNGNAISFLMEHAGMGFVEAVKDLAQQTGLPVPDDDLPPQDRAKAQALRTQQESLTALLDLAARGYQKHLKTSTKAVDYLKRRGLSGEVAREFRLGYAPEGWRSLASLLPDYSDPLLVEAGLVISSEPTAGQATSERATSNTGAQPEPHTGASHAQGQGQLQGQGQGQGQAKRYDRFRDRIMFPIRNAKGDTIGFGGRVLDSGEPKYLNSPETPVFSKGRELYGLFEARTAIRTQGYALVTEGYMDVVALAQLGFANAVATLGTACTPEHVQKLFRFTDAVVFSFDGDAAGRRAAVKAMNAALPFAQDTRSIKFLFLPPEHDPDSYIRAEGAQAFADCIQQAVPLSRFMLDTAAARCDLSSAEGRALMASQARPLWSALPDGALKRQLLPEFAQTIGLATEELADLWKLDTHGPAQRSAASNSNVSNASKRERHFYPEESDHHAFDADAPWPEPEPDWSPSSSPSRGGSAPWTPGARGGRYSKYNRGAKPSTRPRGPAAPLATRADRVARTLLSQPSAWSCLTPEDHHLLAKQPDPLGALFRWLESQWHEHGAQPWAALQQAIAQEDFAQVANQLVSQGLHLQPLQAADDPSPPPPESHAELREVLNRMHIDDLMSRETLALAEAGSHPESLQTYREIHDRRLALQRQLIPASGGDAPAATTPHPASKL